MTEIDPKLRTVLDESSQGCYYVDICDHATRGIRSLPPECLLSRMPFDRFKSENICQFLRGLKFTVCMFLGQTHDEVLIGIIMV